MIGDKLYKKWHFKSNYNLSHASQTTIQSVSTNKMIFASRRTTDFVCRIITFALYFEFSAFAATQPFKTTNAPRQPHVDDDNDDAIRLHKILVISCTRSFDDYIRVESLRDANIRLGLRIDCTYYFHLPFTRQATWSFLHEAMLCGVYIV